LEQRSQIGSACRGSAALAITGKKKHFTY